MCFSAANDRGGIIEHSRRIWRNSIKPQGDENGLDTITENAALVGIHYANPSSISWSIFFEGQTMSVE